jgi:hypothetical protein
MATVTLHMKAGEVGLALSALREFKGRRPVMVGYHMGRAIRALSALQDSFVEQVRPLLDKDNAPLKGQEGAVQALCEQPVEIEATPIPLGDLEGMTVAHPDTIEFLLRLGILCEN